MEVADSSRDIARILEMATRIFTRSELMVAAAAREIREGELVFAGMRLSMIAFALAKRTHAPHATGLFENGVKRDQPVSQLLYTRGNPPNLYQATFCGDTISVMSLLQQGRLQVDFLGAAEADRFGNLNTTWGRRNGRRVRLPGSGGACDIACLAQRTVVILAHRRERLVFQVGHITSPGKGTGHGWRQARGLPARSGPSAIITTMGVLRFGEDGEAYLASIHPGIRMEGVKTMAKVKVKFLQKPTCTTCRKAKAFLEKRKVELDMRDLGKDRLSEEELDQIIGKRDHRKFLNPRNDLYRTRKMGQNPPSREEALKLMAAEPNLIRRPVVLRGSDLVLGYDEEELKRIAK